MRGAQREFASALPLPPREKNVARYLSVRYSAPLALAKYLLSLLGEEEAEALLAAFLSHPPLTLAVNTLRISRENFIAALAEKGIAAEKTRFSPYGVRIAAPIAVANIPGYAEGWLYNGKF